MIRRPALLLALLLLSGCFAPREPDIDDAPARTTLVFGYLDHRASGLPTILVSLRQLEPLPQNPRDPNVYLNVHGEVFMGSGLQPGRYIFNEFIAQACLGIFCGDTERRKYDSEESGFRVRKPGLHYMGGFRYSEKSKGGLFTPIRYRIERIGYPEHKALEAVQPHYRHTEWAPVIAARLKALSG